MRVRGLISFVGVAMVAAVALPTTAWAMKLGTPQFRYDDLDLGVGCGEPSATCVWMQRKLAGATLKAPFTGTVRKWRIATPTPGLYGLAVMHKQPDGEFKWVRASDNESAGGTAETFETKLKIRRGDRVGVFGPGFALRHNAGASWVIFNPPPLIGGSTEPGLPTDGELLYNATLKH